MLGYAPVIGDVTLQEGTAFTCENGVCRPRNDGTRGIFEQLQVAVNRAAAALGIGGGDIDVDSELGADTADRCRDVYLIASGYVPASTITTVTQTELVQALTLRASNLVAKYAVPITAYMERVVSDTYAIDPNSVYRVNDYDERRVAGNTQAPQPAPAPAPRPPAPAAAPRPSRAPIVIAIVGALATVGLIAGGLALSSRHRRRRR